MMQIPDPIHGYIPLDGMYADIINTPEFQRLRSIEQGSFRPVFPGARHDRFIHSLGTYHLATKFVDHFFRNLDADLKITLPPAEENLLKTTFRYAALLHDIGHAPFSHTTENFFTAAHNIWGDLCAAIGGVSAEEHQLFLGARAKSIGAAHEIMSALLLVTERNTFLRRAAAGSVDLALAARMVIGFTYRPGDLKTLTQIPDKRSLGIRNCLIQMLNSSILDVDRLDYLGRDTLMSGYFNAPLDLDTLASSVTAVALGNGMLVPAYRDTALKVFDLMFQAKLSHDTWVLANPAGPYDAALLAHCIRQLHPDYIKEVFTRKALSQGGKTWNNKEYRLLSDVDIAADLKEKRGAPFDELYTREPGKRRTAAWRSYYEYHHIFNDPSNGVTPQAVYDFFQPLIKYLDDNHIFAFDTAAHSAVMTNGDPKAKDAAQFLHNYLTDLAKPSDSAKPYSVVLLDKTNNFTMKVDPAQIRIVFPKNTTPLRAGKYKYSTYADLTGIDTDDKRARSYFFLFRYGGLSRAQLVDLRDKLADVL